ncbi:MAG: copper resistance protein NlpE [Bacteroidetes bacterium]|nr:copper resistance protein NlpE [Bacteroidota bacterium]
MKTIPFAIFMMLFFAACMGKGEPSVNSAPPADKAAADFPHPEQQGKAFSISTEAFYQATLPSTATQGRVLSLRLTPDGNALLTTDNMDGSRPVADKGTWTTLDNGNLFLDLKRVDGTDSTKMEFKPDGDKLVYDGTDFGTAGFTFWVKPIAEAK